jgi:hypothetical protein
MLSLHSAPTRLCDRLPRREWLRLGGLSVVGLSLADVLRADRARAASPTPAAGGATFGRAKNVIFLWLQGGPPQHETFDPKPDAPVEIRGEFRPIQTNVPGIQFCELLPRTAALADRLAVVRSLHTDDNNHDVSAYWILTGYPYGPGSARQIKPTDWPYFGSLVKMLRPSERLPALSTVWIPDLMRLNDNVQPAGQTAGFLGPHWEPERFVGDPSEPGFRIEGLDLPPEIPALRLDRRLDLLTQVERHFARLDCGGAAADYDQISRYAFDLLSSGAAREAFAIQREPDDVRERYGRHKWGQSVLLARRLIEAGVRLVHVNWAREPGDTAVDNPMWDTHAQNADRLQDVLCPQFDVGFTALLEDLEQRGLLSETLVVAIGEFGRTPKINGHGGRDHWGPVFSFALAGAGISGGQVYGASDKNGAYPADNPVLAHDLVATIFHLLGIDPQGMFRDRSDRPHVLCRGTPLWTLLGDAPATAERCPPTGDVALVPPFDSRLLLNAGFEDDVPLLPVADASRRKGWRAEPVANAEGGMRNAELGQSTLATIPLPSREGPGEGSASGPAIGVKRIESLELSYKGTRHVAMGIGLDAAGPTILAADARAVLTQQVRAPMAGWYTLSVQAAGGGRSEADYRDLLLRHFRCRLVLLGYNDLAKDPHNVREYAAVELTPAYSADGQAAWQEFSLERKLRSQDDGAFELSLGVGVKVVLERRTPGELPLEAGATAFIRLDEVKLQFNPRPRDDSVMV